MRKLSTLKALKYIFGALTIMSPIMSPMQMFAQAKPAQKPMPPAPEFATGLQWLNTDHPFTLKDFRGKVVLLDFWTFGCVNCMHIIPDLKKLEDKYKDALVVVGVHSAKFASERSAENIRNAIKRYDLEHPVINDKDFAVWKSYGVDSWPTLFLINPDGNVVGYKAGEGIYDIFDQAIGLLIKDFDAQGKINRTPIKLTLEKEKAEKSFLYYPGKITADTKNNRLFVADSNHHRIVVTNLDGAVLDTIGSGQKGFVNGKFPDAKFARPQGMHYDATANALYVADTDNHAIRKIDLTTKMVTTLVGTGKQMSYPPQGGVGPKVDLSTPWDVTQNGEILYIAMAGIHQLWTYDLKTTRSAPFAGSGGENITDGPLLDALLAQPSGITTDGKLLYFADSEASGIRTADFDSRGSVKTIIGTGLFNFGDIDGKYPKALLQHPLGLALHDGFVYVADTYNHKIRKINPRTREITTFAGTGKPGFADGPAATAMLNEPSGLVFVGDKLYISDTNNQKIRVMDLSTNRITTLKIGLPIAGVMPVVRDGR